MTLKQTVVKSVKNNNVKGNCPDCGEKLHVDWHGKNTCRNCHWQQRKPAN